MANVRSEAISGLFATPPTFADVRVSKGRLRILRAHCTTGTEAAGTKFVLGRLKASDRIIGITLAHPADTMAVGGTHDVGLYQSGNWALADQAVVAVDCYVDGLAMQAVARTTPASVIHNATNALISATKEYGSPLWVAGGVATEPSGGTEYDLVATTGVAACVAGEFTYIVTYVAGD